jgi:hypothetical protein
MSEKDQEEIIDKAKDNDKSETQENTPPKKKKTKIELRLGDIIEIHAPANQDIHQKTYYITYIDHTKIHIINVSDAKPNTLYVSETTHQFTDESIQKIRILSRSEELGFARQNGLLPKTWIDVHFGGEIPATITGEITNLDEDQIEITTFPDLEVLYIDFEYKGIPEHIPIQQIVIRRKPSALKGLASIKTLQGQAENDLAETIAQADSDKASIEFSPEGESTVYIPEGAQPDENIRKDLHRLYTENHPDPIIFGEELEAIEYLVEIPESQQRYGLEIQVNSLIDGLLAKIPNAERTYQVQSAVHNKIERFKQLREQYSLFDKNGDIRDIQTLPPFHKPLLDNLANLRQIPKWISPIATASKKFYDIGAPTDESDAIFIKGTDDIEQQETIKQTTYYDNKGKPEELKYESMHRQINPFMTPFMTPRRNPGVSHILLNAPVQSNVEAILENEPGFVSSVLKDSESSISPAKYVIQRYNLGMPSIRQAVSQTGKKSYTRSEMTPNDSIAIKSFVMYPRPVIQYYAIETPQTSILKRCNLHQTSGGTVMHSRMLKHADFDHIVVDDLKQDIDALMETVFRLTGDLGMGEGVDAANKDHYMTSKNEYASTWLNTFKDFVLSDDIAVSDDAGTYRDFLNVILPRTRTLIRAMQPYLKHDISLYAFVKQLEVFGVFARDITYKQFNDIRYFLKEHIKTVKKQYFEREHEYKTLRNYKSRESLKPPKILSVFSEKRDVYDYLTNVYKTETDQINRTLFNAEILQDIILYDHAEVFVNLLSTMMISLMTPDALMAVTQMAKKGDQPDMGANERIRPKDCARRYVAKKYTSIKDLQRDNQSEDVFYDAEYDETPYAIIKSYADQRRKLSPEDFRAFLEETLKYKHECPPNLAQEMAQTLIEGKHRVQEGEFAILEIRPQLPSTVDPERLDRKTRDEIAREGDARVKYQYYVRRKNNWILDPDITEESLLDTADFFCNMKTDCIANQKAKTCENIQDAASRMREIAKKKSVAEFDRRYTVSIDNLQKSLETALITRVKSLTKQRILREIAERRYNAIAYEMGRQIVVEDILRSPHQPLFDLIVGQDDFVKKQIDIVRFVDRFCRDPMPAELEESERWKYCLDTNTKLVPMILYDLAREFVIGGNYVELQRELAKQYGVLSDDGDAIVDRHSGAVIRKIDYVGENAVFDSETETMGEYIGSTQTNTGVMHPKTTRVFENPTTETIYNVFTAIAKNIDLPPAVIAEIEDFVLRLSLEITKKQVMSEEKYTAAARQSEEKRGKKMPTFQRYWGENIILIVAAMTLVAIQGMIPSIRTTKTFPGCFQSFTGFPFDGVQDTTGLKYIVCVINRLKSSISVWESIQKLNADLLFAHIRPIIEKHVITNPEIQDLFDRKREYLEMHPEVFVPLEHSIRRWTQFLPPVIPFSVKSTVRHLASGFAEEMNASIRNNNRAQRTLIDTVTCKSFAFSYSVIEAVNAIVQKKDTLLKTSGQAPFVENACCNEQGQSHYPIRYFIEDDAKIGEYVATVREYSKLSKTTQALIVPDTFYHPYYTGIRSPVLPTEYTEENMYQTFIHYLNFDRELPVPEVYRGLCPECPAGYDPHASLIEKIAFLKQNGRTFTVESLKQLMILVARKNRVEITRTTPIVPVEFSKDILRAIRDSHTHILSDTFIETLLAVLTAYNPNVMKDEDTAETEALKNYLAVSNSELFAKIMRFIYKNGNLSDRKYKQVYSFLETIQEWSVTQGATPPATSIKQHLLFIENTLYDVIHVFPNIILNDVAFTTVHKHWGLSETHERDVEGVIEKYYAPLNKFKQDPILTELLAKSSIPLMDLYTFVKNFPVIEPIQRGDARFFGLLDKRGMNYVYVHVLYSALAYYIDMTTNVQMVQADIQNNRQTRRDMNRILYDKSVEYSTTVVGDGGSGTGLVSEGAENPLLDEELEYDAGLQEIQVIVGNQQDLEKRVCSMLLNFVEVESDNKAVINMDYGAIINKSRNTKDKEKRKIIHELENMTTEQLNVENTLKNLRIGKWNVGQQTGLFKYDKKTYERERSELALDLMANIGRDDPMDAGMDVGELEDIEREEGVLEMQGEEMDFTMFGEEYTEGAYYEEDRDDEDGGY